jgi:hypothetical protein
LVIFGNPAAAIDRIIREIELASVPLHPGRSFPRKAGSKKRRFPMGRKSSVLLKLLTLTSCTCSSRNSLSSMPTF